MLQVFFITLYVSYVFVLEFKMDDDNDILFLHEGPEDLLSFVGILFLHFLFLVIILVRFERSWPLGCHIVCNSNSL